MHFFIGEYWQMIPTYKESNLLKEEEIFSTEQYLIKSSSTQGVRLKAKAIAKIKLKEKKI